MAENDTHYNGTSDISDNDAAAPLPELEEEMAEWKKSRRIELEKAGSIAEASLRLNGVFEAAQKAADQYLENLRQLSEEHGHE